MKFIVHSVILLFICSSLNASSNAMDSLIQDTSALNKKIDSILFELEETQKINIDEVTIALKSTLYHNDTLSFFKLCKSINKDYYYTNGLGEEGILFIKNCQRILGTESTSKGEFNNDIGNHYSSLELPFEALDYFLKSVEWFKKYHSDKTTIPLGNIADIYYDINDYEKALKYNELALSYSLKLKDNDELLYNTIFDYYRIGFIYQKLDDNLKARSYFEKSLNAAKKYDGDEIKLLALAQAIMFYTDIEDTEKCMLLISDGTSICERSKVCESSIGDFFMLQKNKFYLKIGRLDKAKAPENLGLNPAFPRKLIYSYSAKYYGYKNDMDKTIESYDKFIEEIEEKNIESKKKIIYSIEEKYKNKELTKKNEDLNRDINNRRRVLNIIIPILLLILCLSFLQFLNNRRYKKVNHLLESKKQALEQSNDELERFVHIASHDLKTPLRNIVSFTGLLEKSVEKLEDPNIGEYLSYIKDGGTRLNKLISDTLEFTRISQGEYESVNEHVDLNVLLTGLEKSIFSFIDKKKAKVIKLNSLPILKAHESLFLILFQNIIENGIKYNQSSEPTIKISFKEGETFSSIYFDDNGIGIPEEYKNKVFTMFSRLHNHEKYEGSGLGLATCYKIINQLGGQIKIHNKDETGSLFELLIPTSLISME